MQAFIKLESLPTIPKERRDAYAELAMSVFLKNTPVDQRSLKDAEARSSGSASSSKGHGAMLDDLMGDRDQVGAAGHTCRPCIAQLCGMTNENATSDMHSMLVMLSAIRLQSIQCCQQWSPLTAIDPCNTTLAGLCRLWQSHFAASQLAALQGVQTPHAAGRAQWPRYMPALPFCPSTGGQSRQSSQTWQQQAAAASVAMMAPSCFAPVLFMQHAQLRTAGCGCMDVCLSVRHALVVAACRVRSSHKADQPVQAASHTCHVGLVQIHQLPASCMEQTSSRRCMDTTILNHVCSPGNQLKAVSQQALHRVARSGPTDCADSVRHDERAPSPSYSHCRCEHQQHLRQPGCVTHQPGQSGGQGQGAARQAWAEGLQRV